MAVFGKHSPPHAKRRGFGRSAPRKAVSIFASFILAFSLFPTAAFADSGSSAQQYSLGAAQGESTLTRQSGTANSAAATDSTATSTNSSATTPAVPSTAAASLYSAGGANEGDEVIEISTEPLNLVQNGNFKATDSAANASTNIASTGATAPTTAQRNAIKARLNTALANVSYGTYAGESNWCIVEVRDLQAYISSSASSYARTLIEELINENPDLFYAGASAGAGTATTSSGTYLTKILVQYYYSPSSIKTMKTRYESAMQSLLKWVPTNKSDAEKAKSVHDWLVRNVSYNTSAANKGGPSGYGSWDPWTSYGAVVSKKAVCEGYSLAFMSAMKRLGIQATFVTNANHGWNRVRLYDTLANGSSAGYYWFNLDVTWDDPLPDKGFNNKPNTTYFLKSDAYFKKNNTGSYGEHKTWTPAGTAGTNTKYDNGWSGGVYSGAASRGTVTSLSISPSALSIAPDSTQQLTLNLAQDAQVIAGEAQWSSSNPAVAAVSSTGLVTTGKTTGTATITVKLGGKTATCTVTVKDGVLLSNASITLTSPSFAYKSGLSQRPNPTVKVNGKTLTLNTDYTITWPSDTVNPGTKTATITGKGDYTGTKTFTYTITGDVSQASLSAAINHSYTGSPVKPTITLKFGSTVLKEGTDYTLTWPSDTTNVGTKTVTIKGKGVYTGTKTFTYKIEGTAIAKATITFDQTVRYTGKAVTVKPTVIVNGSIVPASNYTISYKNNTSVGTASITLTGKGSLSGTVTKTFKIVGTATWSRLRGSTQFDTMASIGKIAFTKSDVVVIATSSGFSDALAASALAGRYNAPILMTTPNSLTSQTRSEIKRLGAKTAYVVGGRFAVSDAVLSQIKAAGCSSVTRIRGSAADDTSREIAKAVGNARSDTVIIATQLAYQDALSISPYAYATKSPIILLNSKSALSSDNVSFIRSSKFKKAVIVGGRFAVPTSVENQLKSAGISASNITRLRGSSAYDTSAAIASWGVGNGMSANNLGVATGLGYSDALAGAALCGSKGSVLLLADGTNRTAAVNFVKTKKTTVATGYLFGGKFAIPEAVEKALKSASG